MTCDRDWFLSYSNNRVHCSSKVCPIKLLYQLIVHFTHALQDIHVFPNTYIHTQTPKKNQTKNTHTLLYLHTLTDIQIHVYSHTHIQNIQNIYKLFGLDYSKLYIILLLQFDHLYLHLYVL